MHKTLTGRNKSSHKGDERFWLVHFDISKWDRCLVMMTDESHKILHLKSTLDAHVGTVNAVAFSPDNKILASGGIDPEIRLWSLFKGEQESKLEGHYRTIDTLAFSPDGKTLAGAGFDQSIRLWSLEEEKVKWVLKGHTDAVKSIAFSTDGTKLVSGSVDKTVRMWDLESGKQIFAIEGHEQSTITTIVNKILRKDDDSIGHKGSVTSVAISPDATVMASGSVDETAKLWSAQTGNLINTLKGHNHPVYCVAFSPNGKYLATGCIDDPLKLNGPQKGVPNNDKIIGIWSAANGMMIRAIYVQSYDVRSISFTPDSKILATGGWDYTNNKTTIRLWSVEAGELIRPFEGHYAIISSVDFSPDGRLLASGGDDKSIKLWMVE